MVDRARRHIGSWNDNLVTFRQCRVEDEGRTARGEVERRGQSVEDLAGRWSVRSPRYCSR